MKMKIPWGSASASASEAMQGHVCDRWAARTTTIDIAQQNSEVTVPGGGGVQERGGGGRVVYLGHSRTFHSKIIHFVFGFDTEVVRNKSCGMRGHQSLENTYNMYS